LISWLISFFEITRMRAIAIMVLCLFVLLLGTISFIMPSLGIVKKATPISDSLKNVLSNLISSDTNRKFYTNKKFDKNEKHNISPFNFDPNTLTEAGFKKLGLPDFTVNTILNYRNKGGKFYKVEDLQKMFSLSEPDYLALKSFIKIVPPKQQSSYTSYKKEVVHCEINSVDTATLNKLKGIGSAFAHRIVEYRNSIGGFYSINQLSEVYGLDANLIASLRPNIHVDKSQIKKININEISFQELAEHPYFRNGIALAICKYRKNKKNKIEAVVELQSLSECTPLVIEKIKNYIKF
jgi:competence protein ComEA